MPIEFAPPAPNLQAFNIPPPQSTDPLETLARLGAMKTQALQQQTQELQLQNERLQMQSQQGLMQAYQDAGGDLDRWAKLSADPKYQIIPGHMMQAQQAMAALAKERAQTTLFGSEADKNAMEARDKLHDDLYNAYTDVWNEQDPTKLPGLINSINQRLLAQGYRPADLLQDSSPEGVRQARNAYTTMENLKEMADQQVKAAQAGQAKAEAAKLTTEQQLTQHKIDLYNTLMRTPQALTDRVAATVDPQKYPDLYARALNEARQQADLEGINKVIENYGNMASEQEKTISTETNPEVRQARLADKLTELKLAAPIETQKAVATAVASERARAALSPDTFSQIYDPNARHAAMASTQKYTEDYITKVNDAQRMVDTVNAAQRGNQAALAIVPLAELRAYVNRVNRNELEAVSGGGSLLRQIDNWLSTKTTGSLTAAQAQDVRNLGNLQLLAAKRAYNLNRVATKSIYGVMPPEIDLTGVMGPAAQAGPQAGARLQPGASNLPPIPATIPSQYRSTAHWVPSQKRYIYSPDGGKTWLPAPAAP